ncbi:MAG: hypothetical protein DMG33_13515 [Acidobacteria bacterium]|nr:MAG: hypothetical protein DMG33_13515 [Acidobacteriota bacterium]
MVTWMTVPFGTVPEAWTSAGTMRDRAATIAGFRMDFISPSLLGKFGLHGQSSKGKQEAAKPSNHKLT